MTSLHETLIKEGFELDSVASTSKIKNRMHKKMAEGGEIESYAYIPVMLVEEYILNPSPYEYAIYIKKFDKKSQ